MYRPLALALFACPALASANVMTFDALSGHLATYTEDGITATSGGNPGLPNPLAPYLEASWPFAAKRLDFVTGGLFQAESFDVLAVSSGYCASVPREQRSLCGEVVSDDDQMPYSWASGYVGSELIQSFGFWREPLWETISLSTLGIIDRLSIEVRSSIELGLPGTCNGQQGCGQLAIDNIRLKPVPEPELYALLLLGGFGAWLSRRRLSSRSSPSALEATSEPEQVALQSSCSTR